jgi:hypothetical protein
MHIFAHIAMHIGANIAVRVGAHIAMHIGAHIVVSMVRIQSTKVTADTYLSDL